ncbi:MAG: glycosyltransferase [Actinomycetia bacterium]|nr:glycosyltransferase [Actinomycetes bacterium]
MKFAVAVHGTRGDVEPCAAVGRELVRRGHDVRIAVPPDLTTFVEAAGLPAVTGYGISTQEQTDSDVFRDWWKPRNPLRALREAREYATAGWGEMSRTLDDLTGGTDLVLTGTTYQEVAANVAEKQGVPFATMHYFPARPNSKLVPVRLPAPLIISGMKSAEWAYWRLIKPAEDDQRRDLAMPPTTTPSPRRIVENGSLEIQAYDEALFPGLNDEWRGRRPFVGSITLELETAADEDVAHWIAAGSAPIYFGFGSTPVDSPREMLGVIESVCAELGKRALVTAGSAEWAGLSHSTATKIVPSVHYPSVFPACRAVVHHGGAGTLAAAIRAGVPSVALWSVADQPLWASRAEVLKIGKSRRFSRTTRETLLADLRTVSAPDYAARNRALAEHMTNPADGVSRAADLLEETASTGRFPTNDGH